MSLFDRLPFAPALALAALWAPQAVAQVDYNEDGGPWNQRASAGPDAEVDGWYYNLGITGMRVQLLEEAPTYLLVKHVFQKTPASKKVHVGDLIISAGGKRFETPHKDGYGMDIFGPQGPIVDFAKALELSQGVEHKGQLAITLLRKGKEKQVTLKLGRRNGMYADSFPANCKKTDRVFEALCEYLALHQSEDGSWGSEPHNTFAPLALLASGERKYLAAVEKNVRFHARTTRAKDESWLINWRYTAAGIVMSEYYLATGKKWVLKELEEVYDFLISSQYVDMSQINPASKESHPDSQPKGPLDKHGGWGHNPGFEGYGPICMLTGQGALAFALMSHCGIEVDRERHLAAYAFLERGTGKNGYVWYEDDAAGEDDWADMGRTGAAGIANFLSPYDGEQYMERALEHAKVIGLHTESFPDTHGSPIMGMGYAALAANVVDGSFKNLMRSNRWWFTLSECNDGSFYYQPNRDNAGYGPDSRTSASAVTAFILAIPKRNLHLTGKPFEH